LYLDEVFEALTELKQGNDVFLPLYDRRSCERTGRIYFKVAPVIFVEGLQLFSDERIRRLFDLRLWLDIDEVTALERRLLRQPDYNLTYHQTIALPAQREHVLPLKEYAHVTLNGRQTVKEVTEQTDQVIRQFLGI